jgi:hypothetical protein
MRGVGDSTGQVRQGCFNMLGEAEEHWELGSLDIISMVRIVEDLEHRQQLCPRAKEEHLSGEVHSLLMYWKHFTLAYLL